MGYYAEGYGEVYVEHRRFEEIAKQLDLKEDFLEYLTLYGFDYVLNDEGDMVKLVFEYNKVHQEDTLFVEQLSTFVRPGSWFRWKDEEDSTYVEDFGHPELITRATLGDDKVVGSSGEWVSAWFDSNVNMEVKMCQPVKKQNVPDEPKVTINLKRPNGEEVTWTGTARKLFYMLRSN